jgi:hypothetical protein
LKFRDKFLLRPIPLIPELGHILSDDIGFVLHDAPSNGRFKKASLSLIIG